MRIVKKSISIIFVIVIVLFSVSLFRNYAKLYDAQKIIAEEEKVVENLKSEQEVLKRKLEEASSDTHIEMQLRNELGLAKETETVIVLPEESEIKALAPKNTEFEEEKEMSNIEKWRRLFF